MNWRLDTSTSFSKALCGFGDGGMGGVVCGVGSLCGVGHSLCGKKPCTLNFRLFSNQLL